MTQRLGSRARLASSVAVMLLVAACSSGSASPTTAPATKASLQLDWSYLVYHVPFIWGVDKGHYTAEGIDLEVKQGQGSGTTNDLVAQGQDTFGFADTYTTVQRVGAGAPVKSVMVIQRKSGFGFACLQAAGVREPKDLEGKKVALVAAESTAAIWPAFAEVNDIDVSAVQIADADFSNKVQLLAAEQVDCMIGYVGQDTLQAQLLNDSVQDAIPWVDYGINLMGHGIVVTQDTIDNHPDLVKAFLRATKKSWEEVCAEPQAGIDFYLEKFPDLSDVDKEFSQQSLPQECEKNVPKEGSGGTAYGPTTDAQWQEIIDLAKQYGGVTAEVTPAQVYTNDLLP